MNKRVVDVDELRRVIDCVRTSVESGIPVTDGWRIIDRLLDGEPVLSPEYIREGIANHVEDTFRPEKVWTVLQTAAHIRSIEIHQNKKHAQSPEEVQWRNIKTVVKAIADYAFGSKDDPTYGMFWLCIVNSLTAKDGIGAISLEPLPPTIEIKTTEQPIYWPTARDVGRYGDMSPVEHMRVGLDSDNDVYVSVWGEDGGASVEFCAPGAGGGSSPKTRAALISLMKAMEEDNADSPSKDWWKQRA